MAGSTGGSSGGAARGNAASRPVSKVTTPSGPHFVNHAVNPTPHPFYVKPLGLTPERGKAAGSLMPGAGRSAVRTNPYVVTALFRQNATRPARTFGALGGSYRRLPPVR